MFANYLKTALRNLMRYRQYTLINIISLAVGLAVCILIFLYVTHELSYDRWIPENNRVMRIETRSPYPELPGLNAEAVPTIVGRLFADQLPEIELSTPLIDHSVAVSTDNRSFEQGVTLADPDVFELMGIVLLQGNAETALDDPDSIVLSQQDAIRVFGEGPVLGKTIVAEGQHILKVTGVMANWPQPSDLDVRAFAPVSSPLIEHMPWLLTNWGSFWGATYIRLRDGVTISVFEAAMNALASRTGPANYFKDYSDRGQPPAMEFYLTRATDAHLGSREVGAVERGTTAALWSAGITAALILAIAIINVANLGTMLALKKVREVSIRKALGAGAGQLVLQVMVETVSLAFASMLIGLVIAEALLPTFSLLMNRPLSNDPLYQPVVVAGLFFGALIVGIVSGLYPALVATHFRPVDYLAGVAPRLGVRFRNSLVVLQFSATIALLIMCIVVFAQAQYAKDRDPGFDSGQLVSLGGIERPIVQERQKSFREALRRIPGIDDVAALHGMAGSNYNNRNNVRRDNGVEVNSVRRFAVSDELFTLLGTQPIAGRFFSRDRPLDAVTSPDAGASKSIILNRLAAQQLGFESPSDAIGQEVVTWGDFRSTIIGVIEDIQLRSARSKPTPTYFWIGPHEYRHIVLRVSRNNMPSTLEQIDTVWAEFFPDLPVRRQFVDDAFADYYDAERRQGWLLLFSAGVMVVIAVMGLYGLAALATERRSREIGIRKVLGAHSGNIVQLLLWQFSLPVLLGNLIAWPIAAFALSHWLETFVDHIDLTPLPFLAAGAAVLLMAWVTIIGHTLKVAKTKPIKALRYE